MQVRRYVAGDFEQVREWGAQYGANYEADQFPLVGFIVDGVAAYFMYQTDSSVCFLENMIANRKVDQVKRDQALKLIIKAILDEAKESGFKIAYATTGIPSVVYRAIMNGASAEPRQTLLTKILTTSPSHDG